MIDFEEKQRALVLTDSYIHGIFDLITPMKSGKLYNQLMLFRNRLEEEISLEKAVLEAEKSFRCGK